jgi:hypothetical protein
MEIKFMFAELSNKSPSKKSIWEHAHALYTGTTLILNGLNRYNGFPTGKRSPIHGRPRRKE